MRHRMDNHWSQYIDYGQWNFLFRLNFTMHRTELELNPQIPLLEKAAHGAVYQIFSPRGKIYTVGFRRSALMVDGSEVQKSREAFELPSSIVLLWGALGPRRISDPQGHIAKVVKVVIPPSRWRLLFLDEEKCHSGLLLLRLTILAISIC